VRIAFAFDDRGEAMALFDAEDLREVSLRARLHLALIVYAPPRNDDPLNQSIE